MADSQRIDDLRRRVQRGPTSIAFAQLAEECRRAGHYQEAVDVCRAGLELHPGYLSARVTLGRALIELNDLETALAELQHVLKSAPENLAAIRGVAEIHHRQGSLEQALAQYRAALSLARNDPDLQRTVDELARQVEPPPQPASTDGLSFEQMQQELLQNFPPPPPVAAPAPIAAAAPEPEPEPMPPADAASAEESEDAAVEEKTAAAAPVAEAEAIAPAVEAESVPAEEPTKDVPARTKALHLIAVLEQWMQAIHVARAQPRA